MSFPYVAASTCWNSVPATAGSRDDGAARDVAHATLEHHGHRAGDVLPGKAREGEPRKVARGREQQDEDENPDELRREVREVRRRGRGV